MADASVVQTGAERIGELEPVWRALYEHHREVGRGVSGVRPFEETWTRRRGQYEQWLADEDTALFVAGRDGRVIGYAMLTTGNGPATWDLGERVVEIETLAVLADERGTGVGAALMRASADWAREHGADLLAVGLVHTNDGARRFYAHEGFAPFYLEMVRDLR